jgi:hypothetical protein
MTPHPAAGRRPVFAPDLNDHAPPAACPAAGTFVPLRFTRPDGTYKR